MPFIVLRFHRVTANFSMESCQSRAFYLLLITFVQDAYFGILYDMFRKDYGDRLIAIVKYPEKYLFNVLQKHVRIYDLEKDLGELSPEIHPVEEYFPLIRDFFRKR